MKGVFLNFIFFLSLMLILITQSNGQGLKSTEPCIENLTSAERDQLSKIPDGKMIFNTSTGCLNYYHNKAWRIFCETNNPENSGIDFDKSTGELKYNIDGQWYTFTMIPEENFRDEAISPSINEISDKESTSDLPVDCRKKPTRPYAGRDLVSFDMVELEANKPIHGIGYWCITQGEGGHFVDSTVPNAQFMGVQGITYYLRWTIATQCDTLYDESMVRIRPPCDPEPSQSFAGSDQLNVEVANLSANYPRSGKGSWTILSGLGGHINMPTNPKTTFTGMAGETYVLRWIIRNECGLTQDDLIISIKPPCSPHPSIADAGEDQIEIEKCKLRATHPEHGKGRWKILEGEKGKLFNKDTNFTTFYGKPGETYVLQWTVSTKCGVSSDELVINFSSYCPTEFTDFRDGHKYKSIRLVGQCWMSENLNYRSDFIESHCYDGYEDYCSQFGALYTWYSLMQGKSQENAQGVCPEGWHLPSDNDWQQLVDSSGYTGIELQVDGGSGFDVVMGGARYTNGKFLNRREYAYFWTSTNKDESTAWNRYFPNKSNTIDRFPADKNHSFSVRCIKDE